MVLIFGILGFLTLSDKFIYFTGDFGCGGIRRRGSDISISSRSNITVVIIAATAVAVAVALTTAILQ